MSWPVSPNRGYLSVLHRVSHSDTVHADLYDRKLNCACPASKQPRYEAAFDDDMHAPKSRNATAKEGIADDSLARDRSILMS